MDSLFKTLPLNTLLASMPRGGEGGAESEEEPNLYGTGNYQEFCEYLYDDLYEDGQLKERLSREQRILSGYLSEVFNAGEDAAMDEGKRVFNFTFSFDVNAETKTFSVQFSEQDGDIALEGEQETDFYDFVEKLHDIVAARIIQHNYRAWSRTKRSHDGHGAALEGDDEALDMAADTIAGAWRGAKESYSARLGDAERVRQQLQEANERLQRELQEARKEQQRVGSLAGVTASGEERDGDGFVTVMVGGGVAAAADPAVSHPGERERSEESLAAVRAEAEQTRALLEKLRRDQERQREETQREAARAAAAAAAATLGEASDADDMSMGDSDYEMEDAGSAYVERVELAGVGAPSADKERRIAELERVAREAELRAAISEVRSESAIRIAEAKAEAAEARLQFAQMQSRVNEVPQPSAQQPSFVDQGEELRRQLEIVQKQARDAQLKVVEVQAGARVQALEAELRFVQARSEMSEAHMAELRSRDAADISKKRKRSSDTDGADDRVTQADTKVREAQRREEIAARRAQELETALQAEKRRKRKKTSQPDAATLEAVRAAAQEEEQEKTRAAQEQARVAQEKSAALEQLVAAVQQQAGEQIAGMEDRAREEAERAAQERQRLQAQLKREKKRRKQEQLSETDHDEAEEALEAEHGQEDLEHFRSVNAYVRFIKDSIRSDVREVLEFIKIPGNEVEAYNLISDIFDNMRLDSSAEGDLHRLLQKKEAYFKAFSEGKKRYLEASGADALSQRRRFERGVSEEDQDRFEVLFTQVVIEHIEKEELKKITRIVRNPLAKNHGKFLPIEADSADALTSIARHMGESSNDDLKKCISDYIIYHSRTSEIDGSSSHIIDGIATILVSAAAKSSSVRPIVIIDELELSSLYDAQDADRVSDLKLSLIESYLTLSSDNSRALSDKELGTIVKYAAKAKRPDIVLSLLENQILSSKINKDISSKLLGQIISGIAQNIRYREARVWKRVATVLRGRVGDESLAGYYDSISGDNDEKDVLDVWYPDLNKVAHEEEADVQVESERSEPVSLEREVRTSVERSNGWKDYAQYTLAAGIGGGAIGAMASAVGAAGTLLAGIVLLGIVAGAAICWAVRHAFANPLDGYEERTLERRREGHSRSQEHDRDMHHGEHASRIEEERSRSSASQAR